MPIRLAEVGKPKRVPIVKLILLFAASAASVFALWLLCALALARWRGWQIARWLRDNEGREFPPRNKRALAVKWEDDL